MESHHIFRYTTSVADIPYSNSSSYTPSIPNRLVNSFNFAQPNSPSSPFSNQFHSDTFTTLSDTQDHYSSTENPSRASPSWNSSSSPSSENIKHALLQLETTLMGPDDDEDTVWPRHQDKELRHGANRQHPLCQGISNPVISRNSKELRKIHHYKAFHRVIISSSC